VLVDDDVAEIDADAERDAAFPVDAVIAQCHLALQFDRAAHHQRIKSRRASPSRSLAASRHTLPFGVAPISASAMRLAHNCSGLALTTKSDGRRRI
jgi:hypothetical protein